MVSGHKSPRCLDVQLNPLSPRISAVRQEAHKTTNMHTYGLVTLRKQEIKTSVSTPCRSVAQTSSGFIHWNLSNIVNILETRFPVQQNFYIDFVVSSLKCWNPSTVYAIIAIPTDSKAEKGSFVLICNHWLKTRTGLSDCSPLALQTGRTFWSKKSQNPTGFSREVKSCYSVILLDSAACSW